MVDRASLEYQIHKRHEALSGRGSKMEDGISRTQSPDGVK